MKLRKLFAAGLALVMTLAMAAPTFAAETKSTITVEGGNKGETYTAYQLFDATQSDDEAKVTYTISTTSPWKNVLDGYKYDMNGDETPDQIFTWKAIVGDTTKVTVQYPAEFNTAAHAADLAAYLAKNIPASAAKQEVVANASGVATFTGLNLGYYFVTTSTGALCALDTNNSSVSIREKNEYPTVDKEVNKNNSTIGETLTYTLTVMIPATADKEVKLVDTMESGLTLITAPAAVEGEYTVAVSEDGQTITITFAEDYVKGLTEDTEVTLTYTAYINSDNGVVSTETNDNTVTLYYSKYTQVDEESVETFLASFLKVNGEDLALAGVTFKLTDANGNEIKVVEKTTGTAGTYRVADTTKGDTDYATITTGTDGVIVIEGLGNGTYNLVELSTLPGYNLLPEPYAFTINNANDLYVNNEGEDQDHNVIVNLTGLELPSTGGMGTTLFYLVGGMMVVAAGVLLVTKKRMENK